MNDCHWFDHLTDHPGALHVHTIKSNGAGTLTEVAGAAERAGLSFLIITEHDTRAYAEENAEGWMGSVLIVIGAELTLGAGRFIIIGDVKEIQEDDVLEDALHKAQQAGGITIALPPEDATSRLPTRPLKPGARLRATASSSHSRIQGVSHEGPLPRDLVDGWEFWCGLEDWARGRADRKPMTDPFTRTEHVGLSGPRRDAVRMWDNLTSENRILGFAGLNAHGRSWSSAVPGAALPYEILFRSLTTHVLAPEFPRDSPAMARALLLKALRQGHFHTSQSCIAPPQGFRFVAASPGRPLRLEGDQASYDPRTVLMVRLPIPALIKLIHNGSLLMSAEGQVLEFPVVRPGAYRVEAWLDRRPWIYSNPIWLIPPTDEEKEVQDRETRHQRVQSAVSTYDDLIDLAT